MVRCFAVCLALRCLFGLVVIPLHRDSMRAFSLHSCLSPVMHPAVSIVFCTGSAYVYVMTLELFVVFFAVRMYAHVK